MGRHEGNGGHQNETASSFNRPDSALFGFTLRRSRHPRFKSGIDWSASSQAKSQLGREDRRQCGCCVRCIPFLLEQLTQAAYMVAPLTLMPDIALQPSV